MNTEQPRRGLHIKTAALAQLKSQSPLCLLQAEPAHQGVSHGTYDLIRGPGGPTDGHLIGGRGRPAVTVDIASLLKTAGSNESSVSPPRQLRPASIPPSISSHPSERQPAHGVPSVPPALMPSSRRSMTPHITDQPVKKQSKWSPEEDALIIELRGGGMKWEDVSKRLPGRSAISCRLHYQNYLERRSEWDEERKNKLARLYERCEFQNIERVGAAPIEQHTVLSPFHVVRLTENQTDSSQTCGPR